MNERTSPPESRDLTVVEPIGSSPATHRRGERMRTYVYHPRPEARM